MNGLCSRSNALVGLIALAGASVWSLACADDDCSRLPCPNFIEVFVTELELAETEGVSFSAETTAGTFSFTCVGGEFERSSGEFAGSLAGTCDQDPWVIAPVRGENFLGEELVTLSLTSPDDVLLSTGDTSAFSLTRWNESADCGTCVTVAWTAAPSEL